MTRKLDAIIVGSYKAGTTSLKNYLSEHPNIESHPQHELDGFFDKDITDLEIEQKFDKQFKVNENSKIILGKNVAYYRNNKFLKDIKNHNKAVKLFFIVRNPADRAYSSWKMEKERVGIKEDFKELFKSIEKKEDNFLYKSCFLAGKYGDYYESMLKIFPKENIMLINFEDLANQPLKICKDCFEFLGVTPIFEPNINLVHNQSFKPKSRLLIKIMLLLKKKNNPIKKIIKKVIPYSMFVKIAHKMRFINQSNSKFPSMLDQDKEKLLKLYSSDILKLESISGRDFSDYKTK